ncbi:MAG: hydrogenase maturation protease [Gemmataceae bacterium]
MILVVGYGNELRRDDGVGPLVAREVASWGLPGVVAAASHGLVPELADALSRADEAVFIDASVADRVEVCELAPGPAPSLGHPSGPRWLLTLAEAAFGRRPPAWLITVPAVDFGHGEGLSGVATAGMAEALERVRGLCGLPPPLCGSGTASAARRRVPAGTALGTESALAAPVTIHEGPHDVL